MNRSIPFLTAAVIALTFSSTRAADSPAGSWRLAFPTGDGSSTIVLLAFETKDGQWTGKYLGATTELPQNTAVEAIRVERGQLQFTLKVDDQRYTFDGKLPKAAEQRISGTLAGDMPLVMVTLEPSSLAAFDRFDLIKEIVTRSEPGATLFDAADELFLLATSRKIDAAEVARWADRVNGAAETFGHRWQQAVALRTAQSLMGEAQYTAVAHAQVRLAERLLTATDPPDARLIILETLVKLLKGPDQEVERRRVVAEIAATERTDYDHYRAHFPFKPDSYAGRQGPGNRVVLMELFTGAECPPCVAADLAFDGLARTFKPTEVVQLQYHLNIPYPDPLTSAASLARQKYYGVVGTPSVFVNGKSDDDVGGAARLAVRRFSQFRKRIDPQLELPATAKIALTATRLGDTIQARAKVTELAKPGERLRLRMFIAEPVIRHRGSNGIRFHHMVVRGAIGPETGLPLRQTTVQHTIDVKLGDLRKALVADLDKFQKENDELPFIDNLLALKDLVVVALVQDDGTREVLQAIQVEAK